MRIIRRALITAVVVAFGLGASPALAAPLFPWAAQSFGANDGSSVAETEAISTQADGSAIVTGLFRGNVTFGSTTLTSSTTTYNDIFVAKLDASGSYVWATRAGSTLSDAGYGVSALADGSAIVTGQFRGNVTFGTTTLSAAASDVFVAKINASGSFVWATKAGGTSSDKAWYVSTLADGSAILTGYFEGTATFGSTPLTSAGEEDIFVAKVDASGSFVWATQAGGTTDNDEGVGVSTLADGSTIVTGAFEGPATFGSTTLAGTGDSDIFVAKINPSGSFSWVTQAGGTADDAGFRTSALADGSAIVEGYFEDVASFGPFTLTSAGEEDYFVAKVDSSGTFLWATRAGGTGDDGTESWGVSALVDGSAIVSGSFENTADFGSTTLTSAGDWDVFVAKVDSSGSFLWATQGGGSGEDKGWDVGTLADGSAIVAGPFDGTAAFGSTTLTSFDTDAYVVKVVSPSAAPGSVTATPGSGQATVSWAVPVYSGGAAITSYTASASPGGGTCTATAPSTNCTITGLSNGTRYTFTVTATNATGTSPASATSSAVTPTAAVVTTTTLRPTVLPSRARLISGQAMRLGIRTTNTGTATAASVTSCLRLPQNLVVTRTAGATRSGRTLCFALGDLPAGATRTKVVTVRAVAIRTVTRRVTGTTRSSATNPALTTTQSRAIRISPRTARTPVTG
jgi:hypothetical protein